MSGGLCRLSEKIGQGKGAFRSWDGTALRNFMDVSCEMFAMVFSYSDQFWLFVILYLLCRYPLALTVFLVPAFHTIPQLHIYMIQHHFRLQTIDLYNVASMLKPAFRHLRCDTSTSLHQSHHRIFSCPNGISIVTKICFHCACT